MGTLSSANSQINFWKKYVDGLFETELPPLIGFN